MSKNVDSTIQLRQKTKINQKDLQDISLLHCQVCGSSLGLNWLSKTKQMLICTNLNCIFPFNNEDMNKFICESKHIQTFIQSITKLLSRPSTQEESFSHSNDNLFQEEEEEYEGGIDNERMFSDDFY